MVFEQISEDVDALGGRFYQTPNSFFVLEIKKQKQNTSPVTEAAVCGR